MSQKRIHIKKNDTIVDIIDKIIVHLENNEPIYLEVDDNLALSYYLNLKLLQYRFSAKKISIVTNNAIIKKIAEPLGIKCYSKNDNIEFEENFEKTHILHHNFTFFEYLVYEIKKFFSHFLFTLQRRRLVYKNAKVIKDSNMLILLLWLAVSLVLLIFIFYFAVSKTYVYITPELSIKTVSRNLIFTEQQSQDALDDSHLVVTITPITTSSTMEQTFDISTIDKDSTRNSYGTVEIYNELPIVQSFRPNTRFVTDNGLVFRSSDWIRIPPTRNATIGQTEVTLIADVYDTNNNIIGERGNITTNTILTIPWLKFNRDKIYAKTLSNFTGGLNPKVHILTPDELGKFQGILLEKLKDRAKDQLKENITTNNQNNGTDYDILPVDNILMYSSGAITVMNWVKIGDKTDEVTLSGSINLKTYTYDKDTALTYLKNVLNETLLFGTEKLIWVNDDSIHITDVLIQNTNGAFYMKATTELDGTISYNFEDVSNNLTKKLKNLIANTTEEEAISILHNDPNIANVKISFSPFWLTRVSSNPDNIDFIINK